MKPLPFILFLIFGLLITQITFAQKITLPYQEVGGVPIVKVTIDGNAYDFVFDTGAMQTLIDSALTENLQQIDSTFVIGIYGKRKSISIARLDHLKIGKTVFDPIKVGVHNFKTLSKYFCGVRLSGILGADAMEGYIIEIDPKHRLIKFYSPKLFNKKKLDGFFKSNYWYGPMVKLKINGKKYLMTFDTGSSQGLNLSGNDKLLEYTKTHPHITNYSSGGIGLYGKDHYIAESYKVDTLNIKFGGWFNHTFLPSSPSSVNPEARISNMGFQYIKQFHVVLDQNKHKLYLKLYPQNEQEKYTDPLLKYGFDLGFGFNSNQFYVNARTDLNDQLKIGDIVLTINGAALPKEKCGLEAFKKENYNKEMKMTVLRDGKEKVITYRVPDKLTTRF